MYLSALIGKMVSYSLKYKSKLYPAFLLTPAILILAVVVLLPTLQAFLLSFQSLDFLRDSKPTFIWFQNYLQMVEDESFWAAFGRTIIYTIGSVLGIVGFGLLSALLLNISFPLRGVFRCVFLMPWVLPYAVAALAWSWLYDYQFGLINFVLNTLLKFPPALWLGSSNTALLALVVVSIWKELPFAAIMLLASLQSIPLDLYEAGAIDGAGAWKSFWHITLPGVLGVLSIVTLLEFIWAFKQFPLIYMMTGGGPAQATETLVIQTYKQAFVNFNLGYASTIGVVTLLVSSIFSIIYFKLLNRMER